MLLVEKAIEKLTNKKKMPFLSIAKDGVTVTLQTRKYTATKKANKYLSAVAMVITKGNLAHRIIGNVIVKVDNRPTPTKLFTNEEKAIAWLQKFK